MLRRMISTKFMILIIWAFHPDEKIGVAGYTLLSFFQKKKKRISASIPNAAFRSRKNKKNETSLQKNEKTNCHFALYPVYLLRPIFARL